MHQLDASTLLAVWEQGCLLSQSTRSVQRALLLLSAACDESAATIAALPIGRRDARLLKLRQLTFGAQLTALAACPACNDRLELVLSVGDLLLTTADAQPQSYTLVIEDYELCYRLPTSADLLAVMDTLTPSALLAGCLLESRHFGAPVALELIPERILAGLNADMVEHDPQADMQFSLTCPACSHAWTTTFDIVTYFWYEIDAWAERTLHEIHSLATAYGWLEIEILALTPQRRQRYLELVNR
jgi:hypothetical protein